MSKNNAVAINIEEIKILSSIKVINLPYSFMLLKVQNTSPLMYYTGYTVK